MADFTDEMSIQEELEDTRSKMHQAAKIGQQLLEHNKDLEHQIEKIMEENNKRVEELEQEKYSLGLQLNTKEQMETYHKEEIENLREKIKKDVKAAEEHLNLIHSREIQKMKTTVEDLKGNLEMANLRESQMQDKIKELQYRIEEAESSFNRSALNNTMEEKSVALLDQIAELKSEKNEVASLLKESEEVRKQQDLANSNLMKRLADMQERAEDEHKEAIAYHRTLEEVRLQLEETQAELDLLKLETQDPNRKGNSLFAEVEIKRQEMEKKLISLQVQHESTKKQLHLYKQRVRELKYQIAGLLQMDNGRVSATQFQELEQALARSHTQVETLTRKLHEKTKASHQRKDNGEDDNSFAAGAALVEKAKKETEDVQKELQKERVLRLATEVKIGKFQSQLYTAKQQIDRLHASNIKLELKLSEIKLKGRTESQSSQKDVQDCYVEKINLPLKKEKSPDKETEKSPDKESEIKKDSPNNKQGDTTDIKRENSSDENETADVIGQKSYDEKSPNKRQILGENTDQEKKKMRSGKTVTISDDVEVFEVSGSGEQEEREEMRGGRRKERKVVYVGKRANQNECKQQ